MNSASFLANNRSMEIQRRSVTFNWSNVEYPGICAVIQPVYLFLANLGRNVCGYYQFQKPFLILYAVNLVVDVGFFLCSSIHNRWCKREQDCKLKLFCSTFIWLDCDFVFSDERLITIIRLFNLFQGCKIHTYYWWYWLLWKSFYYIFYKGQSKRN